MTLSSIPTVQPPFELGKHTAKLSVIDSEDAVILLRPRYNADDKQFARMMQGIEHWKKSNHVKLRILVVPHNFDVFALEVKDDRSVDTEGREVEDPADVGRGDPGDEEDHEDLGKPATSSARASDCLGGQ